MPNPKGRRCWVCLEPSTGYDPRTHGHLCDRHHREMDEIAANLYAGHRLTPVEALPYTKPVLCTRLARRPRPGSAD